MVTYK